MSGTYSYNNDYAGGYAAPQPQSYPPPHNGATPSYTRPNDPPPGFKKPDMGRGMSPNVVVREVSRTPSPTPSEINALKPRGGFGSLIKKILDFRSWLTLKNLPYIIAGVIGLTIVILFGIYDQDIIRFLQPPADKIKALPAGFLIFVAILFVISFPPLFGHEIVAPIVGLTYGLGKGFAIVCLGTFLGEIGNFFAFRYCCKARGDRLEKENIKYGALCKIVREGGFKVAAIARLSAIPPHFTTAVFSTCGLNFFVFIAAVIVSLPKQFVTVYIGVVLGEEADGTEDTKDKRISRIVLVVTIIITIVALRYINGKLAAATPSIVYARRKRRQAKLEAESGMGGMYGGSASYGASGSTGAFNPEVSESELPLTAGAQYQRWDSEGRAVGYTGHMNVYDSNRTSGDRGGGLNAQTSAPVARRPDSRDSADSLGWETETQRQFTQAYGAGATQGQNALGPSTIKPIPPPPGTNPFTARQQAQAQTDRFDPFASVENTRVQSPPATSPGPARLYLPPAGGPARVYSPPSTAPPGGYAGVGRYSQDDGGELPTPKYGGGFAQQQQQQQTLQGRTFSPPPPSYRTGAGF